MIKLVLPKKKNKKIIIKKKKKKLKTLTTYVLYPSIVPEVRLNTHLIKHCLEFVVYDGHCQDTFSTYVWQLYCHIITPNFLKVN